MNPFLILFSLFFVELVSCSKPKEPVFLGGASEENSEEAIRLKTIRHREVILPFFQSAPMQQLVGTNDATIAYKAFLQVDPKAAQSAKNVILVTGYNEPFVKYKEVAYDLYAAGFNVWLYDHRGQGHSHRFLKDTTKSYVDDFTSMVGDFDLMVSLVRERFATAKIFAVGSSMGGAVLSAAIESVPIDGVVLLAPMHKIAVFSESIYQLILGGLIKLGCADCVVTTAPELNKQNSFEGNSLTSSKFRYWVWRNEARESEFLFLSRMTVNWAYGALCFSQKVRTGGFKKPGAPGAQTPMILFQAEWDRLVDNAGQDEFLKLYPQAKKVILRQAKHELLMESDFIRDELLGQIIAFTNKINLVK